MVLRTGAVGTTVFEADYRGKSGLATSRCPFLCELRSIALIVLLSARGFAAITLYPVSLPDAQVGIAYSQVFTAGGGSAPYTYAVTSGNLPAGRPAFKLASKGILAGRPNGCNEYPKNTCANPEEPITSSFVVTATDSRGLTGSRRFTIAVYWNPMKASYVAALGTAMSDVQAQIVGMPQPIIPLTGQHFPSNYNWVNTGRAEACDPSATYASTHACRFNNSAAMNLLTDALIRVGMSGIDVNLNPMALSAAEQYTGPLLSDCPSGWWCHTLANYDAMIAYALSHGLTVKLRPVPGSAVAACRLGPSSTEADLETCLTPLYIAAALRWSASIAKFTILHEAVGMFGAVLPFPVTVPVIHAFVSNTAAALKSANANLQVGVASETANPGDAAFFTDYLTIGTLDYVEADLFTSTCDVASYPAMALATVRSWAGAALAADKAIKIGASARPPFLLATCISASETYAIEAAGDIDWSGSDPTTGVDPVWLQTIVPAVSSYGYRTFSLFNTTTLIWYTPKHANSSTIHGTYPDDLMSHLGETSATGVFFSH